MVEHKGLKHYYLLLKKYYVLIYVTFIENESFDNTMNIYFGGVNWSKDDNIELEIGNFLLTISPLADFMPNTMTLEEH